MPQMREKDKTSEKQLKEVEIGDLPVKGLMIQNFRKNWEDARMFNKDLEELKNK